MSVATLQREGSLKIIKSKKKKVRNESKNKYGARYSCERIDVRSKKYREHALGAVYYLDLISFISLVKCRNSIVFAWR